MALQVWLPLNGNLNNQGIGNITSISGTPSYRTPGKLSGSTLDLKTRITFVCPALANLQTLSIAFWGYAGSSSTLTTNWQDLLGFQDISSSGTAGTFRWETTYASTNGIHWHDNATNAFVNGSHTHIDVKDTWCHCCVVFDYQKGKLYTYTNGVLVKTHNHLGGKFNTTGTFYLGETNNIEGMIQDVRIYDHALSDKEVEELAKGLVLHYKLDESNPNLLYTAPKSFSATAYCAYQFNLLENLVANQTYTLQLWDVDVYHSAKTAAQTGVWVYWGGGSVHLFNWAGPTYFIQTGATNYHADYLVKTFTVTSAQASGNGATNAWFNIYNSVGNADGTRNMHIGAWKLEKGSVATPWKDSADNNIIYDSSGYQNNGTPIGNNTLSTNTSRNSFSTNFVSGSYIRVNEHPAVCMPKDAITVNFWQYATSWSNPISCTEGGGWNFENSSGIRFPVYISGVGYKIAQSTITPASTQNAWHMFTGTMDKNNVKIYYDGVEVGTIATSSTNGIGYANNYIFIGAEAAGNTTTPANSNYTGNISDVRIYATALTPAQILDLYNTSATIDNNNNTYVRELVEA